MPNPFYSAPQQQDNFFQSFISFMRQMRGKNPNDIINNLVSSGRISQSQLNSVQQKAKEISAPFEQFRNTFGF